MLLAPGGSQSVLGGASCLGCVCGLSESPSPSDLSFADKAVMRGPCLTASEASRELRKGTALSLKPATQSAPSPPSFSRDLAGLRSGDAEVCVFGGHSCFSDCPGLSSPGRSHRSGLCQEAWGWCWGPAGDGRVLRAEIGLDGGGPLTPSAMELSL